MIPRTLKAAYNRRYWSPPPGATHVLQWLPSALLNPVDRDPRVPGWWEIQPVAAFLAGEPENGHPEENGPADRAEDDLRGFVDAVYGENAVMTPFEMVITVDDSEFTSPAYWLIPAGGDL